jgi:hypothetical protein
MRTVPPSKRLVVDSNLLQSSSLRTFLSKSKSNFAVLTDYVAMEAHKGDTLANIYRRMEIVGDSPTQTTVLESTRLVCGLRGRVGRTLTKPTSNPVNQRCARRTVAYEVADTVVGLLIRELELGPELLDDYTYDPPSLGSRAPSPGG